MRGEWIAPANDPSLAVVRARCLDAVEGLSPRLSMPCRRLVAHLSTANWLLEWNLPRWLGQAFGLPAEVSDELVLANLYGLAHIRLQDDLVDGEATDEGAALIPLSTVLHHLWLRQYVPYFRGREAFWPAFDEILAQWLRATVERGGPDGVELQGGDATAMRRLAERGAPLKVCCVAACILAGREADLAPLAEGIDHLLAGAVLIDHAQDWEADLADGRYNALVAYLSSRERGEALRQAVMEHLCLEDGVRPYLDLAQQQFQRALACVQAVGVPRLEEYLAWARTETEQYGDRLAEAYAGSLQTAVEGLLSSLTGDEQVEVDPHNQVPERRGMRWCAVPTEEG